MTREESGRARAEAAAEGQEIANDVVVTDPRPGPADQLVAHPVPWANPGPGAGL